MFNPQNSGSGQIVPAYLKGVLILAGLLLFAYTLIRAITVPFTPDEAHTLLFYANSFTLYPETYDPMCTNHHWLNSWLMWIIAGFTKNVFALRTPQLIAHLFFLYYSGKLMLKSRNALFAFAGFMLINAHPYVLDFFSIARGYGLSLGLLMGALYFYSEWIKEPDSTRKLVVTLVFSVLAVFSLLSLFNYFLVFISIALVQVLLSGTPRRIKYLQFAALGTGALFVLSLVLPHIFNLKAENVFYFGSKELWEGTVKSIVEKLFYEAPYAGENYFAYTKPVFYLVFLVIITGAVISLYKTGIKKFLLSFEGSMTLLSTGLVVLLMIQHFLFGAPYPYTRTGIFLVIIFTITFLVALQNLPVRDVYRNSITTIAMLILSFHFIACMNTTYVVEWKVCSDAPAILEIIETDSEKRFPGGHPYVSTDGTVGMSLAWFAGQKQPATMTINASWDTTFLPANYYLVEKWMRPFRHMEKDLLLYEGEITGNRLYVDTTY